MPVGIDEYLRPRQSLPERHLMHHQRRELAATTAALPSTPSAAASPSLFAATSSRSQYQHHPQAPQRRQAPHPHHGASTSVRGGSMIHLGYPDRGSSSSSSSSPPPLYAGSGSDVRLTRNNGNGHAHAHGHAHGHGVGQRSASATFQQGSPGATAASGGGGGSAASSTRFQGRSAAAAHAQNALPPPSAPYYHHQPVRHSLTQMDALSAGLGMMATRSSLTMASPSSTTSSASSASFHGYSGVAMADLRSAQYGKSNPSTKTSANTNNHSKTATTTNSTIQSLHSAFDIDDSRASLTSSHQRLSLTSTNANGNTNANANGVDDIIKVEIPKWKSKQHDGARTRGRHPHHHHDDDDDALSPLATRSHMDGHSGMEDDLESSRLSVVPPMSWNPPAGTGTGTNGSGSGQQHQQQQPKDSSHHHAVINGGHAQGKRFTVFQVHVHHQSARVVVLEKRYSDFRELHKVLRHKYATVSKLYFPPKKFFMSLSLHVIEQRREGIENYLNAVLTLRPRPIELMHFLRDHHDGYGSALGSSRAHGSARGRGNGSRRGHNGFGHGDEEDGESDNFSDLSSVRSNAHGLSYMGGSMHSPSSLTGKPMIGMQDFEILKMLGKGSFGKVYMVRRRHDSEILAMKVLRKSELVKRSQVNHTMTERRIMSSTQHPFIVALRYSFQTQSKLVMISDYCCGGEIFFHLKKFRSFSESMVRFYAAELVSALGHLHSKDIVYRDLKPENILLDDQGHVKLTDFGLSKISVSAFGGAKTFCGTPEYLAPEMLISRKKKTEYGQAVDWWSLGTLMYEMLTGWPPFFDRDIEQMCQKVMKAPLKFPAHFGLSADVKNVIAALLERDPKYRIGCRPGAGVEDIKRHPFFAPIDWELLEQRGVKPPFKPRVRSPTDIQNFDKEFTKEAPDHLFLQQDARLPVSPKNEFQGFSYTWDATPEVHSAKSASSVGAKSSFYNTDTRFSDEGYDRQNLMRNYSIS